MRIVFLIGVNDVGGAEFVSYHHVLMAYRNGMDVTVLSGTMGKFYSLILDSGIHIELVGMNPHVRDIEKYLYGCDIVFNCNSFGMTEAAIQLKNKIGFKYLTIIHSNIDWVYNQMLQFDLYTDGYYAIHNKMADDFIGRGVMNADKFTVIENCVDVDRIGKYKGEREEVRNELGYGRNDFVIGMITRVAADKNILDAVRILSKLPKGINGRLLIVGGAAKSKASEDYLERVVRLVKTTVFGRISSHVHITGNLLSDQVYRTMQAFDIGLNCSPSEGLPIAMLEMMGAGITCIMPGIGDIENTLKERGIVIPLRQRLTIKEILAEPCYSNSELDLFVDSIKTICFDRVQREQYSQYAERYVTKFRSLNYQEKLFIKFLDMTKKKMGVIETGNDIRNLKGINEMTNLKSEVFDNSLVSVLMPIRDGNIDWIFSAIESVFNQTYAGKIELVIINHDCRLGLTRQLENLIAEEFCSTEQRMIRLITVTDANLQFSEVLDLGVEDCSGHIIVRMDCDDIAASELIEKHYEFLNRPDNLKIVACGVQLQFFGSKQIITNHPAEIDREKALNMQGTWFINHPGVAIRKEALRQVGGYGKTKTGFAEDYHLWVKLLKAGGVIANLPDVLMNYRCYHKAWRYAEGYQEFLQKEKATLKD